MSPLPWKAARRGSRHYDGGADIIDANGDKINEGPMDREDAEYIVLAVSFFSKDEFLWHTTIEINHKTYTVSKLIMTGAEIRSLANISEDCDLYQEVPGQRDDHIVFDSENIEIREGMFFYTFPKSF